MDTQVSPTVSVIVPTHNRADLIGETLESVLVQTYKDLEVVAVDDGSTGGTDRVVAAFRDWRIRYHWQPNSGFRRTRAIPDLPREAAYGSPSKARPGHMRCPGIRQVIFQLCYRPGGFGPIGRPSSFLLGIFPPHFEPAVSSDPHQAGLLHLNCDKAHHSLGRKPRYGFDRTVQETVACYWAVASGEKVAAVTAAQIRAYMDSSHD
ncbi:glycosyltransferase [Acidobacteria bacterium AH-259-O06]|nr:glycosyltransferase [Acidobacteria bacterium AH-259-O06]